jgi:hypothetical protein
MQYVNVKHPKAIAGPSLTLSRNSAPALEVKIKLENCNKRAREEVPVLVHTVCKEELSRNLRRKGMTW